MQNPGFFLWNFQYCAQMFFQSVNRHSYVSAVPCSIITPSRIVPVHCYMNLRYMRSTIDSLISSNARAISISQITDKLEELSLYDKTGESSSSNVVSRRIPRNLSNSITRHIHIHHYPRSVFSSHMSNICRYMNNIQVPARLKEIMNTTHVPFAPFRALSPGLLDCLSSKKIFMGLCYRFKPGVSNFLMHDFKIPACLDRYKILYDSLGLSITNNYSSIRDLCAFTRQDAFRSAVDVNYYKNLVEVITLYKGTFGRFLILTCTGLGCTVWYTFYPCINGQIPTELFTPIGLYDPFFNIDYLAPTFNCVEFTAASDISEKINSAYSNVPPLSEIGVPASGIVLRNVCFGVMIAFLITAGAVDISNVMNNV
uniref:hypothetical protein n=1 Tax=Cuminum cyminum TaxID=52462 RepID=UPI0023EF85E6|nr:hypothetical protein P4C39_mgp30 [Cuminum cyminum]WDV16693.1 hypothetical protein [Cuminum cyminum]